MRKGNNLSMTNCARKPGDRGWRWLQWTGVAATAFVLLAGCSGSRVYKDTSDTFKGLYAGIVGASGLDENENEPGIPGDEVVAEPAPPEIRCPKTEVLAGTSHRVFYPRGADPRPQNVLYQGTLINTSRECDFSGPSVRIKFGFAGRVLLGPRGTAGTVTLPVRASLVKRDDSAVWTQVYNIPVDISINSRAEHFVKIEENFDL